MRSFVSFFFSTSFLLNRGWLWILFWINFLGTIYGFEWYRNQMVETIQYYGKWLVIFVPDSPTASLFFTLTVLILLYRQKKQSFSLAKDQKHQLTHSIMGLIEAFAIITSFKYGIWAVTMILAGAVQGDPISWPEYMLICSHLGMAAEVMIYAKFMRYHWLHIVIIAAWTLLNDVMDYTQGIFPWLPKPLYDDLHNVQLFTVTLSILSSFLAVILMKKRTTDMF